ncbi:MAG TPA: bifunctional DNA-formamidopyrimidine glycosylase/DNA-(apurinic or apyrimidinic site) lyase, partial [Polyangia bacterium]|nr:bifunctional DNA-formamidopyrimidine glycosylase/DNA-(apurinic or apyrimidinic site) lyase [Polyangia bacterium]
RWCTAPPEQYTGTMPELPEVETVARQLARAVTGRKLLELVVHDPRLGGAGFSRAGGAGIEAVRRVGKQIVFDLRPRGSREAALHLAVHLRMTGRLLLAGKRGEDPPHLRAELLLDRGRVLFVDPRRFGTFRLHDDPARFAPAGFEPLDRALTTDALGRLLAASAQPLKPWLMRQDRLVGIGNIYASEICHRSRFDPRRPAGSLGPVGNARLLAATRAVLRKAVDCCGTTFSDFQDARGEAGGYLRYLAVYAREGERCRRRGCPGRVVRIVQQQRSSFFCPACQS